jgi:SSS family solute:Na+ symporter
VGFHLVDWAIVMTYLAATLGAGLYGKRYVLGIGEFLVAGRKIRLFLGVATLAATEIGTITFMYYAELGFKTGFSSFVNGLIAGLVMICIGGTGFIVRRLRKLGLMTLPEYFEVRYSRRLRVLTGVLVAVGGILNMGVFLKVEGTFLTLITGLPLDYLKVTMTAILLLELLYTVLGGMISIVITDFIQFVFLGVGTVLVTAYTIYSAGWGRMYDAVATNLGRDGFSPISNPQYGWGYLVFQVLLWLAVDTCWQTTAMRTFSTRDPETSQKVFLWTGFIYLGRGMMPMLWGIGALAILGSKYNSLEAMPVMIARILPSGVLGLVVAGMLAATMSVNSSYLLGWSSVIAQDVVAPLRKTALSQRGQVLLNRATNLFVSLFVLFWGIWYTVPGPVYFYLNITGTIFLAGAFACVVGGLYWSRANTTGGYSAMVAGAAGSVAFFFFHLPASYAGLGAFLLAALGMVAGSLLGGGRRPRMNTVPSRIWT